MLVGSESGGLHELVLEERERKEKVWRLLSDLPVSQSGPAAGTGSSGAAASPVRGLHQQGLPGGGGLVVVATPARLYVLGSQQPPADGLSSLEALFAAPLGDPRELPCFLACGLWNGSHHSLHQHETIEVWVWVCVCVCV